MQKTMSLIIIAFICLISSSCHNENESKSDGDNIRVLKVPTEFPTIAAAVANSNEGDWIILAPGKYNESEIDINKAITVSSEWKLLGEESKIDETIIDSNDKKLFIISADGVEISGLKIINGNHTLDILANVSVMHNHFINNLDAISYEEGSGGYVGYNLAENDRDDAIDIDIVVDGNNIKGEILVEHNTIVNCNDDGIEIRLFTQPDQNVKYTIRENTIVGSKNAGIQLISYDKYTGKEFYIHHNIFRDCKTALGCMEGSKTREDLSGASKMDEQVYFYNNTIVGNQMGATGGNKIVAFNNLVVTNTLGGFKQFGANSAIINNLFYKNGSDDFIELNDVVIKSGNIFSTDPLLDKNTFNLDVNSPCINAGKDKFERDGIVFFEIDSKYTVGSAPDIGAIEYHEGNKSAMLKKQLVIDAGEDMVLVSPKSELILKGKLIDSSERTFSSSWNLKTGTGKVEIVSPGEMETKVVFDQEGIYQFSLTCFIGEIVASDYITIRYINNGEGKQLFLKEENINFIEAEDFAYTYGKAEKIDDKSTSGNRYVSLIADKKNTFGSAMEFSIGMAESNVYEMWFLIKSKSYEKNILLVELNNKIVGEITVLKSMDFQWVKMSGKISTTPGQWPLLISNTNEEVDIDKFIISRDPHFIPD